MCLYANAEAKAHGVILHDLLVLLQAYTACSIEVGFFGPLTKRFVYLYERCTVSILQR